MNTLSVLASAEEDSETLSVTRGRQHRYHLELVRNAAELRPHHRPLDQRLQGILGQGKVWEQMKINLRAR